VMLLLLSVVAALGVFTSSLWTTLYAAGYQSDPSKFALTVTLTELCFPYILLVGFAALGMGILNSVGQFAVPAFAPALLNVAVILTPWLFTPIALALELPAVAGLAIATLLGGVLQVVVQFPSLRRAGLLPRPRLDFANPMVRKTLGLMLPLVLGSGIHQLNIMCSRLLASFLPTGSQSFLYYGQRLVEIPQSMFALAIASAALPSLAQQRSQGDHDAARATLRYSLRMSLFIAIPASVALVVLARPTISVLFGRGEFGDFHVRETARSLAWMAASTWAVAATHPITRMYFAYNDTRTPVYCAALNLLTFAVVSVSFMADYGHAAIAAGTSAGALLQLCGLLVGLPRRVGDLGLGEVLKSSARCLFASLAMGAVTYDMARLGSFARGGSFLRDLAVYACVVPFGTLVYLAACRLLGAPELDDLQRALSRRIARA
jgi:putative peptidoglycan lipid II flippase